MEKKEKETSFLLNLVSALSTAVNMRFMSPEHGSVIWKKFLKESSINVVKQERKPIKQGGEDNAGKKD